MSDNEQRSEAVSVMRADAASFYAHGWLFGTSGNLSVRRDAETFLITASGKDKGRLEADDFLLCNLDGEPAETTDQKPSAETLVHCAIYSRFPSVGAVYHVHEPYAALCSDRDESVGETRVARVEMIKGLGIWEEEAEIALPILSNPADTTRLAEHVANFVNEPDFDVDVPMVNIVRHGFYAWGSNAFAAKRHVESLAYLFRYSWESGRA